MNALAAAAQALEARPQGWAIATGLAIVADAIAAAAPDLSDRTPADVERAAQVAAAAFLRALEGPAPVLRLVRE